jgi:hypothetical protein
MDQFERFRGDRGRRWEGLAMALAGLAAMADFDGFDVRINGDPVDQVGQFDDRGDRKMAKSLVPKLKACFLRFGLESGYVLDG